MICLVEALSLEDYDHGDGPNKHLEFVVPVSVLVNDSTVLKEIMGFDCSSHVHKNDICIVQYGLEDVSDIGFGISIETKKDLEVRYGTWNENGTVQFSNFVS